MNTAQLRRTFKYPADNEDDDLPEPLDEDGMSILSSQAQKPTSDQANYCRTRQDNLQSTP